ncbi:MAG: peptidylprolyl isomerase [Paracoccaceae bacterium]
MRENRIFITGAVAVGLAVIAATALKGQLSTVAYSDEDGPGPNLVIEVKGEANGTVVIDLMPEVAPKHVEQIVALANRGAYNGVAFHRVIEGFMAQTGDVEFGRPDQDMSRVGTGASDLPDLPAEFSDIAFDRGIVGMARSTDPDSGNSQFFIMFKEGHFLNGQYTVVGHVVSGMEIVDQIKRGEAGSGAVAAPADVMNTVLVEE